MKYRIIPSSKFKKGLKLAEKRGLDIDKLAKVVNMLADGMVLPSEYKDHQLIGNYAGKRECHIDSDWLLIYEYEDNELILYLVNTGTHSDLFKK
ncbi:MAG: type II toxin-antitoxin system YafQ family toxin [Oscillospiraceae bacterium]|nr:type II toxin-antitoxin system YafQ family toxin [Oscillospiraceae bacterium]